MQESLDYSEVSFKEQGRQLINIYPDVEYQTVKGFGGAFTEATSTTLDKLSKDKREKILKMYFDADIEFAIKLGESIIRCTSEAHSIATYLFD